MDTNFFSVMNPGKKMGSKKLSRTSPDEPGQARTSPDKPGRPAKIAEGAAVLMQYWCNLVQFLRGHREPRSDSS